jgi:hypothetical protein
VPVYKPAVYREQGGSTLTVAAGGTLHVLSSGILQMDSGGKFKSSAGYYNWDILSGHVESSNNEVGSIISSGSAPAVRNIVSTSDGLLAVRWSSAASTLASLVLTPWMLPPDFSTVDPLTVHLFAERSTGGADTSPRALRINVFLGIGDTLVTSTTTALSSTPTDYALTISSGDLLPHPNVLNMKVRMDAASTTDSYHLIGAYAEYNRDA